MTRALTIALLCLTLGTFAAPVTVSFIQPFEFDALPLSTAGLDSGEQTILPGSWSVDMAAGETNFWTTTLGQYTMERGYIVPGVVTNLTVGTRGVAVRYFPSASDAIHFHYTLSSGLASMTFAFYMSNNIGTTSEFWDHVLYEGGGGYAVPQFRGTFFHSHTDAGGTGSPIYTGKGQYWTTGSRVTGGLFTFAQYDVNTRKQISTNSFLAVGGNNVTILKISTDGHDATENVTNYYDNFLVTTNAADFPLLPWDPNVFHVRKDGNDSNSGNGNSAAWAWLTIAKAAATLTAGQVCYVHNDDGDVATYDEAVTFSVDGGAGNLRNFIGETNVVCRNFVVTGDYNRIRGFTFTAIGANTNVTPLVANDAVGVELLDNYFLATGHGTSGGEGSGIRFGNLTNSIIRGNAFAYGGTNGSLTTPSNSKDIADYNGKANSQNVLIEYNTHTESSEYINPSGRRIVIRHGVAGPTSTNTWATAHIDYIQANAALGDAWIGDTWHVENNLRDAHFAVLQYGYPHHITFARNVSVRSGDTVTYLVGENGSTDPTTNINFTGLLIATNSIGPANSEGGARSLGTARPIFIAESSGNTALNNVFRHVTTSATPYQLGTDGSITTPGIDLMYSQGTPTSILLVDDPLWANPGAQNFIPQSGSPLVDAGSPLTTTSDSGSGATVVPIADASWFHDGAGGLTRGSEVYVSTNNSLYVVSMDRAAGTITVNTSISWSNGAPVGFAYRGAGPDIGPYEYGDTLLSAATLSTNGLTYTVTTTGDARMVIFYADGVPQTPDYDSPYTFAAANAGQLVTANAYALRGQATPVIAASGDEEIPPPPAPRTLRATRGSANKVTVRE